MAHHIDDDEWQPPTAAELKVMQAKRERSDKISKIMGDYLLKGYKMLGTTCPKCGTILLRTREGTDYCIACQELDCDTDKDDPAMSADAARAQAAEQNQRDQQRDQAELSDDDDDDDWQPAPTRQSPQQQQPIVRHQPPSQPPPLVRQQPPPRQPPPRAAEERLVAAAALNGNARQPVDDQDDVCYSVSDLPPTGNPTPIPLQPTRERLRTQTSGIYQSLVRSDCGDTIGVLKDKIQWATREMANHGNSVEYTIHMCRVITASADAIGALEKVLGKS